MTANIIHSLLLGHEIETAGAADLRMTCVRTLDEALRQLRKRPVDVILINLKESTATQIEAVRALHSLNIAIPIIVLNDIDQDGFALKAIQCGAQDVIFSSNPKAEALQRSVRASIERKRVEQYRIRHAREDELTGLANRLLLEERFERAMARADRQATLVALVAIELDRTEQLATWHGHDCLDRLMPLIGERLLVDIRETDTLARTRDAGFTWLVEGLAAINDISTLVERVPVLLSDPFDIDGREVSVTASVGVAVCPFHGRNFPTLSKMAEAAMLDVSILNGDGLLMPPLPTAAEKMKSLSPA